MNYINFVEFKKIDIRVGLVLQAERVQNTDKLMRLIVDIGEEKRQIVAGIASHYKPEELIAKKLIVVANLEPKEFRGLESQGMILAADWGDETKVIFVDDKIPLGTRVV